MKITGKKVIELNEREISILRGAARILCDLGEQVDACDDDLSMECNRAYDICMDLTHRVRFEFELDDGDCD